MFVWQGSRCYPSFPKTITRRKGKTKTLHEPLEKGDEKAQKLNLQEDTYAGWHVYSSSPHTTDKKPTFTANHHPLPQATQTIARCLLLHPQSDQPHGLPHHASCSDPKQSGDLILDVAVGSKTLKFPGCPATLFSISQILFPHHTLLCICLFFIALIAVVLPFDLAVYELPLLHFFLYFGVICFLLHWKDIP